MGSAGPSFLRTPTDSTPQWTNTAVPGVAAATSNSAVARSSWIAYRCIAGNRQIARIPPASASRGRAAASGCVGSTMKKPTKRRGCRATAAATDAASPGTLAISAARDT